MESPLAFINRRMQEMKKQPYTGTVVKKPWAVGSKSEHEAVVLVTKDKEYVLRIAGGNAFQDDRLDKFVGIGEITLEAQLIDDYTLVLTLEGERVS